jgi:hypothetical protein
MHKVREGQVLFPRFWVDIKIDPRHIMQVVSQTLRFPVMVKYMIIKKSTSFLVK